MPPIAAPSGNPSVPMSHRCVVGHGPPVVTPGRRRGGSAVAVRVADATGEVDAVGADAFGAPISPTALATATRMTSAVVARMGARRLDAPYARCPMIAAT